MRIGDHHVPDRLGADDRDKAVSVPRTGGAELAARRAAPSDESDRLTFRMLRRNGDGMLLGVRAADHGALGGRRANAFASAGEARRRDQRNRKRNRTTAAIGVAGTLAAEHDVAEAGAGGHARPAVESPAARPPSGRRRTMEQVGDGATI
jgi:hypothetical protein